MCQRVMIAMAMSCNPEILIADEPTTALDVTTQAQIMELIQRLQQERQMSLLLITHDLGVIAETCQNVAVMYAGEVVEKSPTGQLFKNPKHPYTKALLASVPSMETKRDFLPYIKGTVPSLRDMPSGCRFAPRCEFARQLCFGQDPPLIDIDSESKARCWMHSKRWNEEEANK
jgi:oligopeptide/dipeptide ABC transporter ATP-binding protein